MIEKAIYKGEYLIEFTFSEGEVEVIDFLPLIKKMSIWKRFLDPKKFSKFSCDGGRISWPGNVMDFHISHIRGFPPFNSSIKKIIKAPEINQGL